VVIESTCLWEHIYDKLEKGGYQVKLSNPTKTKAIAFAKIKTDSVDASTLADLLRANLVAESYIPTKEVRALRDVVRQRKTLVKGRTQIKNKIHAILIRQGIKLPYKSLCPKAINWLNKNIDINDILINYFNILEQYNNEVKFIENRIEEIAYKNKQARLLMTIPGIGSIRAMEIIAEIADINRFENASKLCSYAGLVPSIRQSGNSLKFGSLIKQASRSLKNALIESSWVAVRSKETNSLKLHYLRLKDKKGKQKAICATARKMLCVIHAMLRKNQEFRA
jgi:transposase